MLDHVETTTIFDRNIKKLAKKHYDLTKLRRVIQIIQMEDQLTLQKDYHLHTLKGDKAGIYELHLERNWLLLYQITGTTELTLLLLRTGTHDII